MVSIRRKILHKGTIVQEQLLNVLQKHEDELSNVEGGTSYDDTELQARIKALEDLDLDNRVKALEDAEE